MSANHPTEPQEVIHMVEVRAAGHESSLSFGTGARRRHELTHRDDTEIASILDFLEILPDQALAGLRVLELACGSGRVTVPMAAAGHRVLATDLSIDVLSLLAERLTERRVIQLGIADRVEIRQADMVSFDIKESFKAVCLPMASITLLNPEQRGATIRCAADHMAIGGALIASIDQILPAAAATSTIRLRPDTYLTEEIDHAGRRRRTILRCRDKEYISEHYLVTPEDLVNDLKEASLFLAAQCSTPDPVRPHHISVILGAVNRR